MIKLIKFTPQIYTEIGLCQEFCDFYLRLKINALKTKLTI